jgi:glycerophosphoryl diester phosphodiesterase
MTLVIAHRGASAAYPENTLTAFNGARELGADWVEMDVRRTADDVIAVCHDAHLPDGRLLAEISASALPPEVPLLIAALEVCAGLGVCIEIKNLPDDPDYDEEHRVSEAVAALMLSRDPDEPTLVTSFNIDAIAPVTRVAPDVPTAWISFDLPDPAQAVERCVAHELQGLHAYMSYVDRRLVERAHAAGLHVHAWTVDDPDRMAELVQCGVDGIVTNLPDVAREVVDRELGRS